MHDKNFLESSTSVNFSESLQQNEEEKKVQENKLQTSQGARVNEQQKK